MSAQTIPIAFNRGTSRRLADSVVHYDNSSDPATADLEISLGSWLTYGGCRPGAAEACVAKAFEVGINFIDTANVYARQGGGVPRRGTGRPPTRLVHPATKLFGAMSDTDRGLSREQVLKQIDASLARLRTNYVDLYQCHRPTGTRRSRNDAGTDGGRRWEGRYPASAMAPDKIRRHSSCRVEKFVSSQPQYSMLWRPERELFELCAQRGISQIVWSPLAQGVLSGKYEPGAQPPTDSRKASGAMGMFMDRYDDTLLERVQQLRTIAGGLGISVAQLALAWVLHEPNVASAIVGASGRSKSGKRRCIGHRPDEETCGASTRSWPTAWYTRLQPRQMQQRNETSQFPFGGAVNGVLIELGFLQRLRRPTSGRASPGSTARRPAPAGTMAASTA
jgi:aryl-alcohol dehydrogenase-like predicted oxidoreductase